MHERPLGAEQPHPRPRAPRQRGRAEVRHHPPTCRQTRNASSSAAVVRASTLGEDAFHRAEQLHRGVDEVAVQVEQDAAALGRRRVLAPALLGHGPPALPAHLVRGTASHEPSADHSRDGGVLGVVAAVLEHGQRHARMPRRRPRRPARRLRVDGQRLVDHARAPGIDHLLAPARRAPARGREHHEVEPAAPSRASRSGTTCGVREVRPGLRRPARGCAVGDRRQLAGPRLGEQGGVDALPGGPVNRPDRRVTMPRQPSPCVSGAVRARRPCRPRSPAAVPRPPDPAGRCRGPAPARAASAPRGCRAARRTRR